MEPKIKYKLGNNDILEGELYYCLIEVPFFNISQNFDFCKSTDTIAGFDVLLGVSFLNSFTFKYNYPSLGEFTLEPIQNLIR